MFRRRGRTLYRVGGVRGVGPELDEPRGRLCCSEAGETDHLHELWPLRLQFNSQLEFGMRVVTWRYFASSLGYVH